jgi:NCAIR mutase (PurE)-related protein
VTTNEARALLDRLLGGQITADEALRAFQAAPVADLGYARVDIHRSLRKNFPEVVYGEGKTPAQVAGIVREIARREQRFLVTRITPAHVRAIRRVLPGALHHELARCVSAPGPARGSDPAHASSSRPGIIAVLSAGTSDMAVAEEAAVTAEVMGNLVLRLYDVGVAGLHRLLAHLETLQRCHVIIAVAGMEGALPSVVAGLVGCPVIAVPTSVGYGANLGGLTALFGMLTSCSSGLTVVNINNGFGAGYAASQINAMIAAGGSDRSQPPLARDGHLSKRPGAAPQPGAGTDGRRGRRGRSAAARRTRSERRTDA